MFCKPLIACMAVLVITCVCSEEIPEGQATEEIRAIRHRLAEEKGKRLLLQNDVDVLMLKVAKLEREGLGENSPKTQQTDNATAAFHALYSKGNLALKVDDILVFNKVTTNHGSGYNALTGIFRASVAGTYHFTIHLLSYPYTLHLGIYKNDVRLANTYAPTYNTGSQSVIVDLEIGDEVYVKAYVQGTVLGGSFNTFAGFLIR